MGCLLVVYIATSFLFLEGFALGSLLVLKFHKISFQVLTCYVVYYYISSTQGCYILIGVLSGSFLCFFVAFVFVHLKLELAFKSYDSYFVLYDLVADH